MDANDPAPAATAPGPVDPTKAVIATEFEHDAPLIACRFDPTGRFVFGTAEDRSIIRWNIADGTKSVLAAHDSWVRALAFTPDGSTMISAGCDDTLAWWETAAEAPAPLRTVKAHAGWIRSVAVSPDGSLVASGGNDRIVRLWRTADGSPVREFAGHERDIYSVLFHPGGASLLSGDLKGVVHQWNLATGEKERSLEAKNLNTYDGGQQVDYGGVRSLALSADGRFLAGAGLHKATNPLGSVNEPLVVRFLWETGEVAGTHVGTDITKSVAWRAVFHPDGTLIACVGGNDGGFLLFWREGEEKAFHQFPMPETARDMDLHPDGLRIATAHFDRRLRITSIAAEPAGPEPAPAPAGA